MVSVGDQQAWRFEFALNDRDFADCLDRPQLVADSQVIDEIDQWLARGRLLAQSVKLGMRARVQREDRAGVDLERGQQPQTVLLRGWECPLMRHDAPAIEFLEPNSRDKSPAMKQPALDVESLRVLINLRPRGPLDHARRHQLREGFFG